MSNKLCHINDLNDPGAKGFDFETPVFVVKKDNQVYGYINKCPHTGVNLEWQENDFLNIDKTFIQCSVHGAIFSIESGSCIQGPCNGIGLKAIDLLIDDNGDIHLHSKQTD